MHNKAVIKDKFYSAFELIEKNDMSNFCLAITVLGGIVEYSLKDFFYTHIYTFSKEDFEGVIKCKNKENYKNQKFNEFTLGLKIGFLRDSKFIEKIGTIHNKSFNNTLKMLKDNGPHNFVSCRNKATHYLIEVASFDKKYIENVARIDACIKARPNSKNDKLSDMNARFDSSFEIASNYDFSLDFELPSYFDENLRSIDKALTIKQYNLVANVLTELGFEGNYDYKTTRYNCFRSINDKYVKESSLPFSYNYTIDNNLLSDFQSYNHISGKFESFSFIEDSEYESSEHLTKCNCLISGEGGIGKSTILYHIYEYCMNYNKTFMKNPFDKDKGYEDFCPIPIFISAHKFRISDGEDYDAKDLKNDIVRQIEECDEFSFFEEAEKLAHLYNETDNNKPFFIFLIDGLNEITYASNYFGKKILNILGEFTEKRIQVIITSRTSIQLNEGYQNKFKQIRAQGLAKEKIIKYIEKKEPSAKQDIINKLKEVKILDILKNPMLLTMYTGYKYGDIELEEFKTGIEGLQLESKLIIRETNGICISEIFWNYIEYRVLFHNIFQPVIEIDNKIKEKLESKQNTDSSSEIDVLEIKELKKVLDKEKYKQEIRLKVVNELVPQIAWELTSRNLFSIEISDCRKKIINDFYEDNKRDLNPYTIEKDGTIDSIVEYLTNSVGLLKCEDNILSFQHQNFRDFFAACHYISEYTPLTGNCEKRTDQIRERLKNEYLSSNLKLFVGELLNEREADSTNSKNDMPLKEILRQYNLKGIKEDSVDDHTVENIFEIDKALDVLNPNDYFNLNIDRLNFNDVKADIMIAFVERVLNNVQIDELMSEIVWNPMKKKLPFTCNADTKTVDMLHNLLMLSARCASNSNMEYLKEYFNIWFRWVRKLYKNETDTPAKKLTNRAIFNHVLRKDRIISLSGPLTNLLYRLLENENIGIGEKGILSIFNEVSNSKPHYLNLMNVFIEPEKIKASEIDDTIYYLASQGGLAPNFSILIMNYYIFKNRDNNLGKELINELVNKMNAEKDEEKKTYIRFRLMSAINYCLQVSLLDNTFTKEDLDNFKSVFKPIMKHLLDDELKSFSDKTADDYQDFKYGYYFPFGILNAFDDGINESFAISQVIEEIFSTEPINYNLFKKLVFDVACSSTGTFFAQNLEYLEENRGTNSNTNDIRLYGCNYLENTYNLFTELIYRLYPVQQASYSYEQDDMIRTSLTEALSILYYNFPLKTETFFDSINAHYLKYGKVGENYRILGLKLESVNAVNNNFEQLCRAKLRGNTFIVKDFILNYRNMWLLPDLANNILLSFETVRESFVGWIENSFIKNIDIYKREPKAFAKQTLTEVLSLLDKEEKAKQEITKV